MRAPAAAIGICYPPAVCSAWCRGRGECGPQNAAGRRRVRCQGHAMKWDFDYLVLPGKFASATSELARKIAGLAPMAVRSMKNVLAQVLEVNVDEEQVRGVGRNVRCLRRFQED